MSNQSHRILRNYRSMGPSRFHAFNQRVRKALPDSARIPESTWVMNPEVISSYLTASQKHDNVYHEAALGSKVVIAEREVLQAQIIDYLDEIASMLELAALRNPDILLVCGFDLAKERRGHTRVKGDLNAAHADHEPAQSGA